jgi:RNA polymerase sigma-70 factor (ECF subfamily)
MLTTARILEGEELQRFNELMEATYKKVYNMAFRLSGSKSDAEDLTQEAFVRAYKNFHDYEGDRPFENWIFRIVTRLFLDLLRNRRRRVKTVSYDSPVAVDGRSDLIAVELADDKPNAESRLLSMTLEEDLQSVLQTLTEEQRMLIELADIEGVPYQEIATMMDKPVGTIRSRLHRTHKLIRKRLELMKARKPRLGSV